jgi:hypothetical protein
LNTAAWLAWRIDIGAGAAREHVRVARALGGLPAIDSAFAAGELSYAKVRALTRVATAESEQAFIHVAKHATASQLEKIVSAYRDIATEPKDAKARVPRPRSFVRRSETPEGMVRIDVQLPPEQANVVWQALLAALDAGRAEAREMEASDVSAEMQEIPVEPETAAHVSAETRAAELATALVDISRAYLDSAPRTLGSGYELVMLTTPEQLEHAPNGIGGHLRDGTPIPQHIARMLACDCSRVDVEISQSGEILNVGRARRTTPSAIGRALWVRDGGCRVPGCDRNRHLHAHHIENWADDGETSLPNLVLLCTGHHAAVHEGTLSVAVRAGKIVFETADGLQLRPGPLRNASIVIT